MEYDARHYPLEVLCRLNVSMEIIVAAHHYNPRATRRSLIFCQTAQAMEHLLDETPSSLTHYEDRKRKKRLLHVRHGPDEEPQDLPLHELVQDDRLSPELLAVLIQKAPAWSLKAPMEQSKRTALHLICQRSNLARCAVAITEYLSKCPKAVVMRAKGGHTPLWYIAVEPEGRIPLNVVKLFVDEWPDLLSVENDANLTPLEAAMIGPNVDGNFLDYVVTKVPGIMTKRFRSGRTILHAACVRAKPRTVRLLVERGAHALSERDVFGETPFACACAHQPAQVVEILLKEHPESLYQCNEHGYNPLFNACRNEDSQVVEFLLEKAPHLVHKRGEFDGWLPLMYACHHDAPSTTVQSLLKFHPKAVEELDSDRRTPLHLACMHDSVDTVNVLVEAEPVLLVRRDSKNLWLPLHTACYYNASAEIITQLLKVYKEGAREPDREGRTPLHLACRELTDLNAIQAILECYPLAMTMSDNQGRAPMHLACRSELDEDVVNLLLTRETLPTTMKTVRNQWTPLHYACYFNASPKTVRQIVMANPSAVKGKDTEGLTPFQLCCKRTVHIETLRILLEVNPDAVHEVDKNGRTTLHFACQNRDLKAWDVAKVLLQAKPSLVEQRTSSENWYPLHHACYHNTSIVALRIIQHLLELFPTAGYQEDFDQRTPLLLACRNKSPDADAIVELFVKRYPELVTKKRAKDGFLPLHYACYYNTSFPSVRHIFNAFPEGAKEPDKEDRTPLQWAWKRHEEKKQIELMICRLYPDALYVEDPDQNRRFWRTKIRMESKMRGLDISSLGSSRRDANSDTSEW